MDLADSPRNERPERLVLVEALSMTATGTVQRFRLREPACDGR